MTANHPLPRSLDPLPDESLPGYLLRLAHRLGLAPARLADLTGLIAESRFGCRIPPGAVLHLSTSARDSFAVATRLSSAEVDRLCLSSISRRYPLPPPVWDSRRSVSRVRLDRWVFAPATRYCPHCLSGDGTAIQRAHGGAWRKSWHLPVVFACVEHWQLLQHRCPACDQPAHATGPGASSVLLPHMRAAALHPAQCRAEISPGNGRRLPVCCGAQLDIPTVTPQTNISADLLELQQRILDLLRVDGPDATISAGRPATPARYFTDLRVLALMLCVSWPTARHLAGSAPIAEAIDHHVEHQHQKIANLRDNSPSVRPGHVFDTPPLDSAATAGLLTIADRILRLSCPDNVREHLRALVPTSTRQARRSLPHGLAIDGPADWSDGLQEACQPLLRTFTRAEPRGRREPIRRTRFGPEHIPAFLPDSWHDRHFGHLDGVNPKLLRRTAAVRLIQMIAGGSMGEAAEYLGINPTGKQYTSAEHVHRWARDRADPRQFDTALHALADELDAAPHRVDYRRRRQALKDWSLTPDTWLSLIDQLPPTPSHIQPELGDLKRQCASEVVWVRVTQGEHLFAPRPIQDQQPRDVQRAWELRRNTIWHQFQANRPLRHYADLRHLLAEHADQLANRIDSCPHRDVVASPGSALNTDDTDQPRALPPGRLASRPADPRSSQHD